jgi:hypothetical protein
MTVHATSCRDPSREEMLEYLTHHFGAWYDSFDIESAMWWFAHDWHGGQGSNLYAAMCASPYQPGPLARALEAADDAAFLYEELDYLYVTHPE